jgi:hypothetical protein
LFGQTIQLTVRAIVSNSGFLSGNMDNESNCEMGMIKFCDSTMMWDGVQTLQELFNFTQARVCQDERVDQKDHLIVRNTDSGHGQESGGKPIRTVAWDYHSMACPQIVVKLQLRLMKRLLNQTNVFESSTAGWNIKIRTGLLG